MYMQGLANFIDDFLGGLMIISYALVVGSVLWAFVILRVTRGDRAHDSVLQRSAAVLKFGSVALAWTVGIKLVIKGMVLWGTLGELPIAAYAGTVQFKAGFLRVLLALAFVYVSKRLVREPANLRLWHATASLAIPLVISGAWLVHAVGRFEYREPLMFATVMHQLAAAVWFGCVAQLLALWYAARSDAEAKALWPHAITRFGILGVISVVMLFATGIPLTFVYVGSLDGLFGTGYGSLIVTKVWLLLVALGFAYLNNRAGKRWLHLRQIEGLVKKVPFYIEAETFVLIGVLFIAATLSSQPPSVDIPDRTAKVAEVVYMFQPRLPRITSPSHEELLAGEAGRVAVVNKVPSVAGRDWSDYNHNVAGIFLTTMAIIAMLHYWRRWNWTEYWPIGFIALGIFLFFRSDAETWPLGPIGFWESTFKNGEVFQHRIATLVALVIGYLEIKARTQVDARKLQFMFPMLCAFGGILLLTHAHAEFELKSEFLIQSTHTTMGLLAVIMASGRWLELRLVTPEGRVEGKIAGFTAFFAMFIMGAIMMFYREPLY
jgi:putative copper resistance protein D